MNGIIQWLTTILEHLKCWAIVNPWERGIRIRAGRHTKLLDPGWHFRIPLVDSVVLTNNRLRICAFPDQTILTKDRKTVSAAGNVGFRITDPLKAMLSLKQPEFSCAALVQSSVSQYVSDRSLEELDIREMESSAKDELTAVVDGIEIEFVRVTDFTVVNRTFRLLQERWQPSTSVDGHDKYEG